MLPQLACGGRTPTPKKLSADSSRMPRATASVSETITACAAFGSKWTPMSRAWLASNGQRDARAEQHARQDVASKIVGAEPVRRRRRVAPMREVELFRRIGRD